MSLQGPQERSGIARHDAPSGDDEHVESPQDLAAYPEALSNQPFQVIASHRFCDKAPWYRQSEAWRVQPVSPRKHRHQLIARAASTSREAGEVSSATKPHAPRKPRARHDFTARGLGSGVQGLSRALPLTRRALRTRRPALVFIRARKPCRLLRFKTLGWKVLFIGALEPGDKGSRALETRGRMLLSGSLWCQ
jgi:hypothetical protein